MSQYELEVEFENMGGHLNAYTSREHTVYYAKVFAGDVPKAVGVLSDMLTSPRLDEAAIELERGVILRELQEVNAQQEEVIFDLLHETAYPRSGLGRTILGSPENIAKLGRRDLEAYIRTHDTGPRIVVAGAGAVEHGALVKLAEKAFGALPGGGGGGAGTAAAAAAAAAADEPALFVGSQIRQRDDELPLAHVAVAFETGGWTHPHAFPLMVAQTILGQWDRTMGAGPNMASALCRKVGEGNLAHSLSAFNTTYKDTGLFGVYAVAEPTNVWELQNTVMFELVRLCHSAGEDEVERAKKQLLTSLLGSLDGSTAICEDIGRQILTYGRRMTPAEILARVDAVDAAAVRAAARAVINDKEVAVAGVGNMCVGGRPPPRLAAARSARPCAPPPIVLRSHEMPDINWFRRRTYRLSA